MNANVSEESFDEAFQRVREMDASLDEQLRTFADAARQRRPDFAAAVDRLVERLRRYGAGGTAPQAGEPMPPFVLPDDAGHMVSLDQLLTQGPVAVTFHRGHWCPYCRININALAQAHKEIAAEGGQIVILYDTGYGNSGGVNGSSGGQLPPLVVVSARTRGIGLQARPLIASVCPSNTFPAEPPIASQI